jgi:subtilisin family serine protease
MWLPTKGVLNRNTGFLLPTPELTITIPATAENAITVGAYDAYLDSYADFSGRGFLSAFGRVKPELVAPGVNITTTAPGGGYTQLTGTSFAAPFVAGCAALLLEYGIVRGKSPYLYGEKLKSYLLAGARPLRGIDIYPDIRVGYGALCLKNSIPV